jgi:hypothetical protein
VTPTGGSNVQTARETNRETAGVAEREVARETDRVAMDNQVRNEEAYTANAAVIRNSQLMGNVMDLRA